MPSNIGRRLCKRAVVGRRTGPYEIDSFDAWWDDRFGHPDGACDLPATALHHWEQRVALWGSLFSAEKDLFTNEVSGFGCGRLQRELLSFPQTTRSSLRSALFTALIEEQSPELARLPPPVPSSWRYRLNHATPVPSILRTMQPGWGKAD